MFPCSRLGCSGSADLLSRALFRIAATELYESVPSANARAQAPSSRSAWYCWASRRMPIQERNPCSGMRTPSQDDLD